jgi:hypothetical protein
MTGQLELTDPLPLADRVRKARRQSVCTACRAPIRVGEPIAHLRQRPGWCHVACAPGVRQLAATITDHPAPGGAEQEGTTG